MPTVSIHDEFIQLMLNEYTRSRKKFPAFVNPNHGITVLTEEFLELVRDVNNGCQDVENTRQECIQIAAMAMAFYLELL